MRSHGTCDPNPIGSMALVTVLYMGLNRAVTRCTYIGRNVRIIHRSSKERGTLQFVADIVSSYYIRDVGFLKKCFEKVCFLLRRMETRNERQASVHHVFVPASWRLPSYADINSEKLREAMWISSPRPRNSVIISLERNLALLPVTYRSTFFIRVKPFRTDSNSAKS